MKNITIIELQENQLNHIAAAGVGGKIFKVFKKVNFIRSILKAIDENI